LDGGDTFLFGPGAGFQDHLGLGLLLDFPPW